MIKDKIKSRDELSILCKHIKKSGKTIGFTSGAFDLVHAGHADYLEKAAAICDILIVGVNSDLSVKRYKGEDRPLISEKHRIKVVAAFEFVNYVFLFDERRNKKNIELLKPDFYIKAGDYNQESLTSASDVKSYGGEVKLIPVTEDISTTSIIKRITRLNQSDKSEWVEYDNAVHREIRPAKKSPALFLDRDGTINEEVLYLHNPDDWKPVPGAVEGIKKFQNMGYRIIIVTNQPGIGLGYFPESDFYAVNRRMLKNFSKAGVLIDKIYFCPHSKSQKCGCRKPELGLLKRAEEDLNIDLLKSVIIGDKTSDIETGRRAGITTFLVETGFAGKDKEYDAVPDYTIETIKEAADIMLNRERV
ncbi:HAD-IIIA family hydrolase [bacterium]|nr:HAD-IIIA family hydrolase [bacterium]